MHSGVAGRSIVSGRAVAYRAKLSATRQRGIVYHAGRQDTADGREDLKEMEGDFLSEWQCLGSVIGGVGVVSRSKPYSETGEGKWRCRESRSPALIVVRGSKRLRK